MSSALQQAAAAPLTALIAAANVLVFLHMWNSRAGYEAVSISYRRVVAERQWYRVVSSAFCHLSALHLLMNVYGLWGFGALEAALGSGWYLETTCLLLLAGTACWLGGLHVLVARFGRAELADSSAVGYSGVLFGWMTLAMMREPALGLALPGGVSLPVVFMPFVYLFLTKLVVPRSSFSGHLSGSGWRARSLPPPRPRLLRRTSFRRAALPPRMRMRALERIRLFRALTRAGADRALPAAPASPAPTRPHRPQLPRATSWAGPTSSAASGATGCGRRSCTSRPSCC